MRLLTLTTFCLLTFLVQAQEMLAPLEYIPMPEVNAVRAKSAGIDTVELPFIDDFSSDKFIGSASNEVLWIDRNVYVNNTFSLNQPTINVATFDGLDDTGYPYDFSQASSYGISDYLSSAPINLQGANNVYLSFFFQRGGIVWVDPDEHGDSLIVEFKNMNTGSWERVWREEGTYSSDFEHVIIPVEGGKFLQKGFQFRFLTYGYLSGAVNQWHVDFVRLDKDRNASDLVINDAAWTKVNKYNVLNEYSVMPWEMYQELGNSAAASGLDVTVNNLHSSNKLLKTNAVEALYDGVVINTVPFGGDKIVDAESEFTYKYNFSSPIIDPTFSVTEEYPEFDVNVIFSSTTSGQGLVVDNDTLRIKQRFGPMLAYDDGSAEFAYHNKAAGGKVAQQFTVLGSDTITSVRMHFLPQGDDFSGDNILVTVWSSLSPETIIFQNTTFGYPDYSNGQNGFIEYYLDEPAIVDGTFYVGYTQTNDVYMNIGYDANTIKPGKLFYNRGFGFNNSSVDGVLMIRPVFGHGTVGVKEIVKSPFAPQISIYPNPASNMLTVSSDEHISLLELRDFSGKQILNSTQNNIDVSQVANGVYLLSARFENGKVSTQKVIVQH